MKNSTTEFKKSISILNDFYKSIEFSLQKMTFIGQNQYVLYKALQDIPLGYLKLMLKTQNPKQYWF